MQEPVPLPRLLITFSIAFQGAGSPHRLSKLALPPCPLAERGPWHIGFPKYHNPAHPHKGAAAPGHPTQVLAGIPLPNYPADPIYWGDKKSNGPQKAINLTAASQRTPPDEDPNRSQQGAEIGCPGETRGLWEPFREHIKVNQAKTLELWMQKAHRGLKPFASTDKVRGSWEAARDAGSRSTEQPPSQTCPSIRSSPGCWQAALATIGFNNSSRWKLACKEQINWGGDCKRLFYCTPFLGQTVSGNAAGEKPAGFGLVIMCWHTRTPMKFFTFISGERKIIPSLGVSLPCCLGSRGEGTPMPGMSTNCGNSLEPVPLESNWHFEINLCQEPSRSILQQS